MAITALIICLIMGEPIPLEKLLCTASLSKVAPKALTTGLGGTTAKSLE